MEVGFNSLERQGKTLLANDDNHYNSAVPIMNLPAEILVVILKGAAIDCDDDPSIIVALVCSIWRQICFSTPSIWNTPTFVDLESSPSLLDLQLRLSYPLPLQIVILSGRDQRACSTILQHSHRWKDISFQSFGQKVYGMLQAANASFPMLKHLTLTDRTGQLLASHTPFRLFHNTSALSTLSINDCWTVDALHVPWSQLVQLTVSSDHNEVRTAAIDMLRHCPNLRNFT